MTSSVEESTKTPETATAAPNQQQQQQPPPPPLPPLKPPSEEAVPLTDDGGLYKLILKKSTANATVVTRANVDEDDSLAKPNPGDHVTVHYVGRYFGGDRDGQVYSSTRGEGHKQGEPVTFKLDSGQTLKALERCLPTMQRGELCRIFARSDYAFGDETDDHGNCSSGGGSSSPCCCKSVDNAGCPGPCANVAIDVELLDWRGEDISADKDGSILRSVVRHGEGFVSPTLASRVTVTLRGRIIPSPSEPGSPDNLVEFLPLERLEFELGDQLPPTDGFCPGIETALCKMFKSELANVWLLNPELHGLDADGCQELSVPPNASLVYQVELLDFVKPKEVWQLSRREKISEAEVAKARSVACLTSGNLKLAYLHCKRVVDYLEWDADFKDDADLLADRNRLLTAGRLNFALACLKTRRFQQAVSQCSAVLEKLDSKNEKALYRRGQARLETCDYDLALNDFRACLAVNPNNSAAKAGVQKAIAGAKQVEQRERRVFAGMFDRFAKQDAKSNVGGDAFSGADFPIDTWDNSLADGMLSIPQELEAFGEEMPSKKQQKRSGGGGVGGGGIANSTIAESKDEK